MTIRIGQLYRSTVQPQLVLKIDSVPSTNNTIQIYGARIMEADNNLHVGKISYVTKNGILDFFRRIEAYSPDWEV